MSGVGESEAMEMVSWFLCKEAASMNVTCMEALASNARKRGSLSRSKQAFLAQEANLEAADIVYSRKRTRSSEPQVYNGFQYSRLSGNADSSSSRAKASYSVDGSHYQNSMDLSPRSQKIVQLERELSELKNSSQKASSWTDRQSDNRFQGRSDVGRSIFV